MKTPVEGGAVTDCIPAKLFLLVKRTWEGASQETNYSDYRNVDGEMVPFGFVMQGGDLGRMISRVARAEVQRPYSRIYVSTCVK